MLEWCLEVVHKREILLIVGVVHYEEQHDGREAEEDSEEIMKMANHSRPQRTGSGRGPCDPGKYETSETSAPGGSH